jgi:hypothetical protein
MKNLLRISLMAVAAAAITGCAGKTKLLYHAGDEAPPEFLAGPAAVLLTNFEGYSATLTASLPQRVGPPKVVAGDLLEREGRLIFQPATGVKGRHVRSEGGMFFIWHEDRHEGFVLNDPLQAYAPELSGVAVTNIVWKRNPASEEAADGHPCRRVEAVVESNDGSSVRFRVWEAEDAKHFPVRIASATSGGLTLDFSNLRMELPPPELFYPPDGFTKYASSTTLMNELIVRQTAYNKSMAGDNLGPAPTGLVAAPEKWRTPTQQ